MERKLKDYLLLFLKGTAMGAADTVPGVSGGTIAFITGIYEELIGTISRVNFSLLKTWKKEGFASMWQQLNGNFLVALLSGIAFSVFTLMRLTRYLLDTHPILIWSFFFGLVLASIWYVGKQIKRWHAGSVLILLISAGIAFWVTTISGSESLAHADWFLFLAGAIAVIAMILPGISGAYILVLLGAYEEVTQAVSDFDFKKILLVGAGIVVGLLSFSKLLKWLFSKYETLTLAALTGFIIGSLNKIWPWKKVLDTEIINGKLQILSEKSVWPAQFDGDPKILLALISFVGGFLIILVLENLASKLSAPHESQ